MSNRGKSTIKSQKRSPLKAAQPVLRLLYSGALGPVESTPVYIPSEGFALGRDETQGLSMADDPRASRHHADVFRSGRNQKIILADKGSSNGTFVNGVRIDEAQLEDGDLIRIGDSFLLFRVTPLKAPDAEVPGLFGSAPALARVRSLIKKVAETEVSALILGESGTGKGVAARAIHQMSGRAGQLITLNCSAIPEQLAESQLFGHRKGSFTGANQDQEGVFRAADRGTLFLDEVGDLPLTIQPKLLVAIEEQIIAPVGSVKPQRVDVRVVAATNAPLQEEVTAKRFRGDLWARLSDFVIEMPPLKDRKEDILPILLDSIRTPQPSLEPDLVEALLLYPWPFNVRELLKTGRELEIRGSDAGTWTLDMLEGRLAVGDQRFPAPPPELSTAPMRVFRDRKTSEPPDKDRLIELLEQHRGVLADIARETGRSRRQVRRWCEQFGIDPGNYRG